MYNHHIMSKTPWIKYTNKRGAYSGQYYLVYFEEEGSVSVADQRQLLEDEVQVGGLFRTVLPGHRVQVKCGRSTYPARVDAIGKNNILTSVEFILGTIPIGHS